GGRDHWTFTSALLMGAGIKGNQSIGGLDSKAIGRPISLETGEMTDNGVMLLPQHLGATLLALGDVDYGRHVNQDVHPISAVML
ncbi:MAG: transcriptional initiation protein Tat, partial [Myxococcota bacterium]|nr:transcriptional initiation protein Tat [Myxococcota bacterium]